MGMLKTAEVLEPDRAEAARQLGTHHLEYEGVRHHTVVTVPHHARKRASGFVLRGPVGAMDECSLAEAPRS